jgi:hypothetical protein
MQRYLLRQHAIHRAAPIQNRDLCELGATGGCPDSPAYRELHGAVGILCASFAKFLQLLHVFRVVVLHPQHSEHQRKQSAILLASFVACPNRVVLDSLYLKRWYFSETGLVILHIFNACCLAVTSVRGRFVVVVAVVIVVVTAAAAAVVVVVVAAVVAAVVVVVVGTVVVEVVCPALCSGVLTLNYEAPSVTSLGIKRHPRVGACGGCTAVEIV